MKYVCFGYYDKSKFDGMTESIVAPNGVILVNYERAGAVRTGSL